jgi:heavy metal translocating P-type ATPase
MAETGDEGPPAALTTDPVARYQSIGAVGEALSGEDHSAASTIDPTPSTIRRRINHAGGLLALPELRWAATSLVLFLGALLAIAAGAPTWLRAIIFAGCYVSGGWEPGLVGIRALRDRTLDVDLLMVGAAIGAAAIGQALDGALLIVIFSTSGALEAVATKRTQDSVRSLLTLAPEQATRLEAGAEERVDTSALAVGDIILVRPGERIGADGVVVDGASEVDQASITGEALPVYRRLDDEVFAGSLNGEGVLWVRVSRPAAESVVARIVALVEEASATKATTQLFVERIEQRYSIAMVCATLGVFIVPLLLGDPLTPTLLRAMTFMIVASPCAVVLATMPPLLVAIANSGRHGVLVKSAVVMEQLGVVTQVVFDKTGTLTEGTPRLAEVFVTDSSLSETDLMRFAAAAELPSEHPIGRTIVAAARDRSLAIPVVEEFQSTPGHGVEAHVEGRRVRVGSPRLLAGARTGALIDVVTAHIDRIELAGGTAVVVLVDGAPAGVFALSDRLRPNAAGTVLRLERLTERPPVLLTGDNDRAARRLGADVGIAEVHGELLPQDKVHAVRSLQAGDVSVLVVGDGVNDAPALAAANVGIAMGRQGSDLALQTADGVIVRDDLNTLPAVIDLSRHARRVVKANLIFAVSVIVGLVTVDLFAHLPLPLGVAGHEGSTVVVGLNGLRLLRKSAWRTGGGV